MVLSEGQLEVLCNTIANTLQRQNSPIQFYPLRAQKQLQLIQQEYTNNSILNSPIYPESSFAFINDLFKISYGISIELKEGKFLVKEEKASHHFSKKVDFLNLVEYMIKQFNFKSARDKMDLRNLDDLIIPTKEGYVSFKANFESNLWHNIYRLSNKNNNPSVQKIEDQMAMYLSTAHPEIHTLYITSPEYGDICTASLITNCNQKSEIEGKGTYRLHLKKYILIDMVHGNFKALQDYPDLDKKICYYLWDALCTYASSKNSSIFVNTLNSDFSPEMNIFLTSIQQGYSISPLEKKMLYETAAPDSNNIGFSDYFEVLSFLSFIQNTSHRTKDSFTYDGEQYLHTFPLDAENKWESGDYHQIGGYAQGMVFHEHPTRIRPSVGLLTDSSQIPHIPVYHYENTNNPLMLPCQFWDPRPIWQRKGLFDDLFNILKRK